MSVYSNLAVQYKGKGTEMKVAGINFEWKRAMLISNNISDIYISGNRVEACLVYSESMLQTQREQNKMRARKDGVHIIREIPASHCVIAFYLLQKQVNVTDKRILVIDLQEQFTEISLVDCLNDSCRTKEVARIDYTEMIKKDDELINSILRQIKTLTYKHRLKNVKVLLSGDRKRVGDISEKLKLQLKDNGIYAYKSEEAAVLGAAVYSNKWEASSCRYGINNDSVLNLVSSWKGSYEFIAPELQEAYMKLLKAIRNRDASVVLCGKGEMYCQVIYSLLEDFPELEFVWDYYNSPYSHSKKGGIHTVSATLNYKNERELLARIITKSEDIIRNCLTQNLLSDTEIVERVYRYIANHYHYLKTKTSNGGYPDYAYTLETLLRNGVCKGYAVSLSYILNRLQIPCMYVHGPADGARGFGEHAWNIIQTPEGLFRHMDVTWDLGKPVYKMKHMLQDDIAMRARRHSWKYSKYPACV